MKIAMIGQKGSPAIYGGIERHAEELSWRLVKLGHSVDLYCRPWYCKKRPATFKGINLVYTPSIKSKHFDAISHTLFSTLHALIKGVDIIHYHAVGPALLCWIPKLLRPNTKVVVTFHCIDRHHQKWGLVARIMLRLGEMSACRFADETITVSKTLRDYCQLSFGRMTNYIPNGITPMTCKTNSALKKFDLEPNKYITYVGRLVRHKGTHYLIEAFNRLSENHPEIIGNMKLAIVGDSSFTDDYVKEIKELAKNNHRIVFTGYQSGQTLDELFANAYLVAQPSESEGLPISVLEAMSHGKTVLASDIPENMEIVAKHGISFKNKSVTSLMLKLTHLIQQPKLVTNAGKSARQFVEKNYNWDDITNETSLLYESLYLEVEPAFQV